jgi:hypothetical protein
MPDEEGWPAITWTDRRSDLAVRLRLCWFAVRHPVRRWGPRCADDPPWRLADAGTCIIYRGHTDLTPEGDLWHGDGNGYIWTADRWAWRGPMIDLATEYRDHPDRDTDGDQYQGIFTEEPPGA